MQDATTPSSLPLDFGPATPLPGSSPPTTAGSVPPGVPEHDAPKHDTSEQEALQKVEGAIEQVDQLLRPVAQPEAPARTPSDVAGAVEEKLGELDHLLEAQLLEDRLTHVPTTERFDRAVSIVLTLRGSQPGLEEQVALLRSKLPQAEIVLVDTGVAGAARESLERCLALPQVRAVWNANHYTTCDADWLGAAAAREIIVLFEPGLCQPADIEPLVMPVMKRCCGAVYGVSATDEVHANRHRTRLAAAIIGWLTGQPLSGQPIRCRVIRQSLLSRLGSKPLGTLSEAALTAKLARRGVSIYEMPIHASTPASLPSLWRTLRSIAGTIRHSIRAGTTANDRR